MSGLSRARTRVAARRAGLVVAMALSITGCGDTGGVLGSLFGAQSLADLESYANGVLARKSGKIEELPPVEPYISYGYQSAEATDPFEPFYKEEPPKPPTKEGGSGGGPQPPANHIAEELERYPLDALRMMGTLENSDELWGIVRSPDGNIHRVKPGDYMGKNYGKINAITEAGIELLEIIPDGQGGWTERPAQLALVEE